MPEEFRYPLTRYCLRGGALTLPRAMVGLFPESGEVTALDTRSETEYTLVVADPRSVLGLGPMFKQHRLAVNDELLIRRLEDGRFAITPVKREHRPDYSSRESIRAVLDDLVAASVPVTEAEVRALYPGIPDDLALTEAFAADERFVQREGRWHNALSLAYPLEPAPTPRAVNVLQAPEERGSDQALGRGATSEGHGSEVGAEAYASVATPDRSGAPLGAGAAAVAAADAATHDHGSRRLDQADGRAQGAYQGQAAEQARPQAQTAYQVQAVEQARLQAPPAYQGQALDQARPQAQLHERTETGAAARTPDLGPMEMQAGLWQQDAPGSASPGREAARPQATVLERRRPAPNPGRGERVADRLADDDAPTFVGERFDEIDADDLEDGAALEVTELANRLRSVMAPMGFRLEPVARGQLNLVAEMGRQGYTVLVQLLTRNERLDWADLLARRRASNVRYLAVVGDHRALMRLVSPAQLARATMWSWQALERLAALQRTVAFSPIELQSHFERDGLFEKGLERFEAAVAKRVAERGAVSELLTRLAVMRAPTVFLLEDLAGELDLPRDRLLGLLELLSEAPFHLVAKVDQGEFVLRQRVSDALTGLASYATSLRERLPGKQVEKLTGLAEPDLLTEAELDDQPT